METHTDTVKMPDVEMTKDTIKLTVTPTVVVKKETSTVVVPHVSVSRQALMPKGRLARGDYCRASTPRRIFRSSQVPEGVAF